MFSGWGIRTLSAASPCFNPQGYHVGTVWPHDNSIIAMGFKRYGFEIELNRLALRGSSTPPKPSRTTACRSCSGA